MADKNTVLEVVDLCKNFKHRNHFLDKERKLSAVDHVSFQMVEGEILGLLGESGCGKTTLARMLLHLLSPSSGKILLDGQEIQNLNGRKFRKLRKNIQMVYQNPFDCLDSSYTIYQLLEEPLKLWYPELSKAERKKKILSMLSSCGLEENTLMKKPTEFSGGQLQRISIARALLAQPRILIADEIISALDIPVQNQILQLLLSLKKEKKLTVLFITHDLSVAEKMSDRIMVMKDGKILEIGTPGSVFENTEHQYIQALKSAVFTFAGNCSGSAI